MSTNLGGINWQAKQDGNPDGACLNYPECQNMTPGGTTTENDLCTQCLDDARYQDSPLPAP